MSASVDRIRRTMNVETTPRDKGLVLTLRVVAYDNGMIELDGVPINSSEKGYDPAHGWLGTGEVIMSTLMEFQRQVNVRRATLPFWGRSRSRRDASLVKPGEPIPEDQFPGNPVEHLPG